MIFIYFTEKLRKKLIVNEVIVAKNSLYFPLELKMHISKNKNRWIQNKGNPIYNDKKGNYW